MNIGIDIRAAQIASSGTRGIGRYISDLVKGVTQFAPEHSYTLIAFPDQAVPHWAEDLQPRVRIVTLRTRLLGEYHATHPVKYVWRAGYIIAQRSHGKALAQLVVQERLDVLHQPCAVEFLFFPGCRPKCRYLQTFYDAIPAVFPELYQPLWSAAQQFVYRRQLAACRQADVLVAISNSARADAIRYAGASPKKVRVVYPAVPEIYQPVTDPRRQEDCYRRLKVTPPYFLFCSAPDVTKNIPRILEAFSLFSQRCAQQHQLVMVTQAADSVRAAAFDASLTPDQVLITGFVSDADLVTLYSGAVALVSPSLYEGFGLPAAQAMRAGTPPIVSNRSAQPEVAGDAGLPVDPDDPDAICEAMSLLASSPAMRAELSARGRVQAQKFDWQHQARAMLEIYRGA
jgi:glycosyltransferase involved in cell wall biosynthesis